MEFKVEHSLQYKNLSTEPEMVSSSVKETTFDETSLKETFGKFPVTCSICKSDNLTVHRYEIVEGEKIDEQINVYSIVHAFEPFKVVCENGHES